MNLLISLGFLAIALIRIFSSGHSSFLQYKLFGMKTDLILALYFFLVAVLALLLTHSYLLVLFELEKNIPLASLRELELNW